MASPCVQPEYTVEVHFAQRLAANEKKTRDRAVKRLRHWIGARSRKGSGVEEGELLRLWKGLFYCMWMCDKAVVQEELADQIADMPHCFARPPQAIKFYDTFILTMKREWMGIDHLRMDKFLMLVRRTFRQMLVLLHNNDWDDSLTELFLNALRRCALNPDVAACPDGLRYQIANVFLDELAREGTEDLPAKKASEFLVPFAELAAKTLNKKLRDVILEDIFQDVVERSNVGEEDEGEEEDEGIASDEERKKRKSSANAIKKKKRRRRKDDDDDDDSDEEEEEEEEEEEDDVDILQKVMFPEEMVPPLEYDYRFLADKLFELASASCIPPRNRKPIYAMVQRFQSLAKGVYPMPNLLEEIRNEKDNEYLKDELPWWKKLQAREKQKKRRRKRRRGKKGGSDGDGTGEDGGEEEGEREEEEEEGVAKKKRRREMSRDAVARETTSIKESGEGEKERKKKKKKRVKDSLTGSEAEGEGGEVGDTGAPTGDDKLAVEGIEADTSRAEIKRAKRKKKKAVSEEHQISKDSVESEGAVDGVGIKPTGSGVAMIDSGSLSSKKSRGVRKKVNLSPSDNSSTDDGGIYLPISKALFRDSISSTEDVTEVTITPSTKTRRKQKGKKDVLRNSAAADDTVGSTSTTPKKKISSSPETTTLPRSKVSQDGGGETSKPFASFQPVATPVAYVKKSKALREQPPSTLPRAKGKSKAVPQFTPPMTRKRVKIALSKNEAQAVHEYKQRVKASPGVPFDGSKKPTHSVLKQTPQKSEAATGQVKGSSKGSAMRSAKGSTKKAMRRAKATDFF